MILTTWYFPKIDDEIEKKKVNYQQEYQFTVHKDEYFMLVSIYHTSE